MTNERLEEIRDGIKNQLRKWPLSTVCELLDEIDRLKNSERKPCPCGAVPEKIAVLAEASDDAFAFGTCCGKWYVGFCRFGEQDAMKSISMAIKAWNAAPRG